MPKQSSPQRPAPRRSRKLRLLLLLLSVLSCLVLGLGLAWWFVHRYEWAGPWVANTLRAAIGTDRVAKLEDRVYDAEDRWNQHWRKSEKPRAYWEVPAPAGSGAVAPQKASKDPATTPPRATPATLSFRPRDVGPMHKSWSAPGDGAWLAMVDARHPSDSPRLYKTLIHPDAGRSWAELFVIAVDLAQVELHLWPGYQEPKSLAVEGAEKMKERTPARTALIPPEHQTELLAAFNGGFMAEHGYYGMRVQGVTLVEPRKNACTIGAYPGHKLQIRSYSELEPTWGEQLWFRQTPACMVESGALHPGLADPRARTWGATLDGETVIRRSAIGIDAAGSVLYVGISNSTTAKVMAQGMVHAGAAHVAQLDVNWSYPKFLTYQPATPGGELVGIAAMPGFEFDPADYVRKRAMRDFFYLTRRSQSAVTVSSPPSEVAPASSVAPTDSANIPLAPAMSVVTPPPEPSTSIRSPSHSRRRKAR